ncbi:MAG: hypothetical protein WBL70_05480 [Candidatus Acidiferrales bacterium]
MKPIMQIRRARRSRRRPFSPSEPEIVSGNFVGRRLSDLSDEELQRFMSKDARRQTKSAHVSLLAPSSHWCFDLSQYWFAKYELERRKPESHREANASLNILVSDAGETIAQKLVEFGYRAASRKYHPDRGGDTAIMQKVNVAREFARNRLKS